MKKRKFDAARVITVNGGYREEPSTELYIVPFGAPPPYASPTVDPSEIKPIKTPAKPIKKRTAGSKKTL